MTDSSTDILLIGAGAMSATLASMLNQLNPDFSITMVESLEQPMLESSNGWNNAGTGHAAYCELNYTPQLDDGSVDVHRAFGINARYEVSLQYWSYLVKLGALPEPQQFINPIPHMSVVWGEKNINFLRKRHAELIKHPMFKDMQFTDDLEVLKQWLPLVMKGRDPNQKVAATRVDYGTDVNFAAVGKGMLDHLRKQQNYTLLTHTRATDLTQLKDSSWQVDLKDSHSGSTQRVNCKFVFIGAGGAALHLLQKSGIPEGKGYAGFPVSGQWLVCNNPEVIERHRAKAYGIGPVDAPPMSVPHLDTRMINGEKGLLFGPYAGFTTKFLIHGSFLDLLKSIRLNNLKPILKVAIHNMSLVRYLIKEVLQSQQSRMRALREFYPEAKDEDWELKAAGQRVQIIKPCPEKGGKIEFGTETVHSADGTLACLLGASPGASLLVPIILDIIETCFSQQLDTPEWQAKIREIIPSYGISIVSHKDLFLRIRQDTLATLKLSSDSKK